MSSLAAPVLSGRLADRSVAVVTVPGADEQVVTALSEQVAAAGGTVAARYDLTADLVDPTQKSLVDTLGSQLLTQQAEGRRRRRRVDVRPDRAAARASRSRARTRPGRTSTARHAPCSTPSAAPA